MITQENYYTEKEHFSVSKFKRYDRCEVDGVRGGEYPTSTAMLIGSYVDSYVEGTLDQFIAENPEIISSRGATKGELKADFKKAQELCEFIDDDKNLSKFLSGEKQVIMTGTIAGVPFKIKMDSYSKGKAIVDLKVMATITNKDGSYYDFITKWGYDIQLAVYQEIVRQNTGEVLPCYIAAVTKEAVTDSAIVQIPQSVLNQALGYVEMKVQEFKEIEDGLKEASGCGHCSTCKGERKVTPIISMRQLMGEGDGLI